MYQSISPIPPPFKKTAGIILYTCMYSQQEYNYSADTTNQIKKITNNKSHQRVIKLSYWQEHGYNHPTLIYFL